MKLISCLWAVMKLIAGRAEALSWASLRQALWRQSTLRIMRRSASAVWRLENVQQLRPKKALDEPLVPLKGELVKKHRKPMMGIFAPSKAKRHVEVDDA